MSDIRWEDPPADTRGSGTRGKWFQVLAPLIAHPKRWAIIATRENSIASGRAAYELRIRKVKTPPGRWEFSARTVDGEHRVYARYLGPDENGGAE